MHLSVDVSPEVESDASDIVAYYHRIDPELALRFLASLGDALARISAYPECGRILRGDLRRMLLPGFPYLVTYRLAEGVARVQLLTHSRRDPAAIAALDQPG